MLTSFACKIRSILKPYNGLAVDKHDNKINGDVLMMDVFNDDDHHADD